MKQNEDKIFFRQIYPSKGLEDLIESYFVYQNPTNQSMKMTIFPDGFFKIVLEFQGANILRYFQTGVWTKEGEIISPPHSSIYGIKFKILAPEYIFQKEIASIVFPLQDLPLSFWNIQDIKLGNFQEFVEKIEIKLLASLNQKKIQPKKLQLSQLLYLMNGNISAEKVSNQINWSNRQINRYLNTYLGVSLKTYLNIQKCHSSYCHIGKGEFYPKNNYFDQSHFIREIRKHTGKTPKEIYKNQNDRFIQKKFTK
jgi:AraC-like DNA-binding protein